MVLPTNIGFLKASFAVDTGASVNVLSEEAYLALKRASRGGRWPLKPTDKRLMGISQAPLRILGLVQLPIRLGKCTHVLKLDFYVISNFSLPSDGLLGLESLKSHLIDIRPNHNSITWKGKYFKAMTNPGPLLTNYSRPNKTSNVCDISSILKEDPSTQNGSTSCGESNSMVDSTDFKTLSKDWQTSRATVLNTQVIAAHTAAHIQVNIPNAPSGADVCLEGPSRLYSLAVEPTLNTIRPDGTTSALVVNSSNRDITLKSGVYLTQALIYTQKVTPDPIEIPSACIGSVSSSSGNIESDMTSTLDSLVNVTDYPESKQALMNLLHSYRDIIALSGEPLGHTTYAQHYIKLKPHTEPVYVPAYRLPHSQREIVDQQVECMLKEGVIQASTSPWNSPIFLVPKRTGGYRPVIDFRRVNQVTEDDRFPLPVLKDLLMSLGSGNAVYSSLDLLSGYWQVPLAPESRKITAFSTPKGHFEWLRMPFGLKSAPITFQRLMNTIFAPMIGKNVYAYLDDLIIFSKDIASHLTDLESVLLRLREAGLKVKLSKCDFLKKSLAFLGHVVDQEGIHPMDDKIKAITQFPTPKKVENVRSFLGLCGYYRSFVKGFSSIASPLNMLLKKDVTFHWSAAQEQSFNKLKHALTNAPILVFPDYNKPFILYTDASALGLGAVLMQEGADSKNRVIAYASRTLNSAESNYSVTHQEALAVVWALNTFKDIIFGYKIICYTDHSAITKLFEGRKLSGRLARWDLTIQEFNPTFKYVPGSANKVADSLSRNVPLGAVTSNKQNGTATSSPTNSFTLSDMKQAQRQHEIWSKVIHHLESGDEISIPTLHIPLKQFLLNADGLLCRYWENKRHPVTQLIVPDQYIPYVLQLLHDSPVSGHPGKERTLIAGRLKYYWPTMKRDIDQYIDDCVTCAKYKGFVNKPAPILTYPPPTRPWQVVSIDLLQLMPSYKGSKYLLVCVDHFSRFTVLCALKDKTADAVAHALITKLFIVHSTPEVLLSDNGSEFRNELLKEICAQYDIKQAFISAYHAASNGLAERTNRKILEAIRPVVGELLDTWEDWLPHVAACINSSVCESTEYSPHFIVYGQELRLPYDILTTKARPVYNMDDYTKWHMKLFSDIHHKVTQNLVKSKAALCAKQIKNASPVEFKPGDHVMILTPERRSKLAPKFLGPHVITKRLHGNKFEVLDPLTNTLQNVHNDRLKRTSAPVQTAPANNSNSNTTITSQGVSPSSPSTPAISHPYNLRNRV